MLDLSLIKRAIEWHFATLEDLTGKIESIVFPKTFEKVEDMLGTDEPVIITGTVNLAEDPRKFFPQSIQLLKEQAEQRVSAVRITMDTLSMHPHTLPKLKQVLLSYRGSVPIHLVMSDGNGRARIPLGEDFMVNPTPQMAAKINEIFNENSVSFVIDGKLEDYRA